VLARTGVGGPREVTISGGSRRRSLERAGDPPEGRGVWRVNRQSRDGEWLLTGQKGRGRVNEGGAGGGAEKNTKGEVGGGKGGEWEGWNIYRD